MIAPNTERQTIWIALVASCFAFGALSVAAYLSSLYHLRLICEAFAASYLIILTMGAWLATYSVIKRLLVACVGVAFVVIVCRIVLADGFSAWLEVAIWYLPMASILCAGLRLAGYSIDLSGQRISNSTYSLRTILLATLCVAVILPTCSLLARFRAGGEFNSVLWLADALVLVVPITLICVGIVSCVLSDRLFHALAFLIAAPLFGLVICRIYGWIEFLPLVLVITAVAVLAFGMTYAARSLGFQLVLRKTA